MTTYKKESEFIDYLQQLTAGVTAKTFKVSEKYIPMKLGIYNLMTFDNEEKTHMRPSLFSDYPDNIDAELIKFKDAGEQEIEVVLADSIHSIQKSNEKETNKHIKA